MNENLRLAIKNKSDELIAKRNDAIAKLNALFSDDLVNRMDLIFEIRGLNDCLNAYKSVIDFLDAEEMNQQNLGSIL